MQQFCSRAAARVRFILALVVIVAMAAGLWFALGKPTPAAAPPSTQSGSVASADERGAALDLLTPSSPRR